MSADSAEDSEVSSLFEVKVARKLVLREPCISCLLLTNLLLYFRNYADTRQLRMTVLRQVTMGTKLSVIRHIRIG